VLVQLVVRVVESKKPQELAYASTYRAAFRPASSVTSVKVPSLLLR